MSKEHWWKHLEVGDVVSYTVPSGSITLTILSLQAPHKGMVTGKAIAASGLYKEHLQRDFTNFYPAEDWQLVEKAWVFDDLDTTLDI